MKRIGLLFVASFLIIAGFSQFSQPDWIDAQGYYDLAALGAENGPIYLIFNYHTLNTEWPEQTITSIEGELDGFGLYDLTKNIEVDQMFKDFELPLDFILLCN